MELDRDGIAKKLTAFSNHLLQVEPDLYLNYVNQFGMNEEQVLWVGGLISDEDRRIIYDIYNKWSFTYSRS